MRIINATEFKAKCLELLDKLQRTGEELVISKHGKPVAKVIPQNAAKPWLALRDGGSFIGDPFEPVVSESEIDALKRN